MEHIAYCIVNLKLGGSCQMLLWLKNWGCGTEFEALSLVKPFSDLLLISSKTAWLMRKAFCDSSSLVPFLILPENDVVILIATVHVIKTRNKIVQGSVLYTTLFFLLLLLPFIGLWWDFCKTINHERALMPTKCQKPFTLARPWIWSKIWSH